jgi:CO/xanthine dehydrogenase Mo-binding subunit
MPTVGKSVVRLDAQSKVTGTAVYARDLSVPGMLYMKLVFAGRPHARILRVDTARALACPGVHGVFTARDVPYNRYGLLIPDQPVFCDEVVRFVGDRVAAVVAETREQAEAAAREVIVEYEDLPIVASPEEALLPGAPILHPEHPDNILRTIRLRRGDVKAAMAAADVVVDRTYYTSYQEHAFMEPEAGLGYLDEQGRVTVHGAGQNAHDDQNQIAAALCLPLNQVRVFYGPIGGAFGGREDISVQLVLALAAWRLGRPVKIEWTRSESIKSHHKRHPAWLHYKWGATRDGRLVAAEMDITTDAGAYASTSTSVLENFLFAATGPYRIPNVRIDGRTVYTNNVSAGAVRGFGAPQAVFASELQMAHLAEALAIDPVTIRLRNCLREGDTLATGSPAPAGGDLPEIIEACARAAGALETAEGYQLPTLAASPADHALGKRRGFGLAISMKNAGFSFGFPEGSTARVVLCGGAAIETAEIHTAAAEVGQGVHSVLAQIAAERLEIPIERVTVVVSDTVSIADAGPASASRLTFFAGNAVIGAADRALARWRDEDRPAVGEYRYDAPTTFPFDPETGKTPFGSVSFSYAAQAVEVEVDTATGTVRLDRVIAVQDPGRAVNPQQVEAQIEGGVVQAQGWALMENFVTDRGRVLTDTLSTYLIPTAVDVPASVETHLLERPDPEGPLGVRGVGEAPFGPLAPAIACAVRDATGVWFDRIPLTPEAVWRGLHGR